MFDIFSSYTNKLGLCEDFTNLTNTFFFSTK